jgi:hypothetical protein
VSEVERAETGEPGKEGSRAEIRLLSSLLIVFSVIKIAGSSLAFMAGLVATGGSDASGGRTLFWIPQVLFYTVLLAAARRLRRLEPRARSAVLGLCALSLAVIVLSNLLDFTIGAGHERPALAIAIKLRLLASGDAWDIVIPVMAILCLWRPVVRRLFEDP